LNYILIIIIILNDRNLRIIIILIIIWNRGIIIIFIIPKQTNWIKLPIAIPNFSIATVSLFLGAFILNIHAMNGTRISLGTWNYKD
jgi:hypothetical protein